MRKDYLNTTAAGFHAQQAKIVTNTTTNKVAWVIDNAALLALTARQAEYEPLYTAAADKETRSRADNAAYKAIFVTYRKEMREFCQSYLIHNPKIPVFDKKAMGLNIRDIEPTPRGKIDTFPYVRVNAKGGGVLGARVRPEKDSKNASMHPLADVVECRFTTAPVGDPAPESWEACAKFATSRKAIFEIDAGPKAIGQRFYGFFRWVNESNPRNNSVWTEPISVVVS